LAQKKKSYWQERQEKKYLAGEKKVNDYYKDLKKSFEQAKKEIQSVINDFYVRYATENGVSYTDAQKLLDKAEIGELKDFIRKVYENMGKYNQELNNMSIKARITRYQALEKQIDAILKQLYAIEYQIKGEELLKDVYTDTYYQTWYNIDVYHGFHQEFAQISAKTVDELIRYPWSGVTFSSRLWRQKDHLLQKINESVTSMLIRGQNPKVLAPEFAKIFQAKEYEAYRLLHTEYSFIVEQATLAGYKEDGVEKYQWLGTLDLKTCSDCGGLDGKEFKIEDAVTGETSPPKHPLCRCTTTPVYDPVYDNKDDLPKGTRTARDPVTGKTYSVPADMTYKEWYKKYVEGNPAAVLEEKKWKNRYTDEKQFERYKEVLGKDLGIKSLEAFQNLKYNDIEKWEEVKRDYKYANMLKKRRIVVLGNNNRSLPLEGEPNTIIDLVDNGRVKQRRIYGDSGKVTKDIDTSDHGKPKYHSMGAHKHEYDYNKKETRGKPDYFTTEELRQNKDIIKEGDNYNDDRDR